MSRKKEYIRKNRRCQKYADELRKLLETIKYEKTNLNQKLNDYHDKKLGRLESSCFRKELARFHNKINYSRFLLQKIQRF